jgi:hypothetical protein
MRALQRGGEIVVYRFPSPTLHPSPQLVFTVETVFGSNAGREMISQFSAIALKNLWDNLGVTRKQWNHWNEELQTGRYIPVLAKLPQLSHLASVDEGVISYRDSSLELLRAECEQALTKVRADSAREVLQDLVTACTLALQRKGAVLVHPFGLEAR